MDAERVIFEERGWKLSEIPYNYAVSHKNKTTYWTSIDTATKWILENSDFTSLELKKLTKDCPKKPSRTVLAVIRPC